MISYDYATYYYIDKLLEQLASERPFIVTIA